MSFNDKKRGRHARFSTMRVFVCAAITFLGLGLPGVLLQAAPNIPPAMLEQFKRMSPSEQRAMAKQYGIALPAMSVGAMDGRDGAADIPEVPLLQNRGVYQDSEGADGPTRESVLRDLIEAQKE